MRREPRLSQEVRQIAEAVTLQSSAPPGPPEHPSAVHFRSCDGRRRLAAAGCPGVEHAHLQVWAVPLQPPVA